MKRYLLPLVLATVLAVLLGVVVTACGSESTASRTTVLGISSTIPQADRGANGRSSPTTVTTLPEFTDAELLAGIASVFESSTPALAEEATPVIMEHPATSAVRVFEYDPGVNALVLQVDTTYDPTDGESILEYAWSLTQGVSGFYLALIEQDPFAAEPFIPFFPDFLLTVDGVDYFVDGMTMISISIDETDRGEWESSFIGYRIG